MEEIYRKVLVSFNRDLKDRELIEVMLQFVTEVIYAEYAGKQDGFDQMELEYLEGVLFPASRIALGYSVPVERHRRVLDPTAMWVRSSQKRPELTRRNTLEQAVYWTAHTAFEVACCAKDRDRWLGRVVTCLMLVNALTPITGERLEESLMAICDY